MSGIEPIIDVGLHPHPVVLLPWDPPPPGGAQCDFVGTTRPETHADHGQLRALDYEAHEPLAVVRLNELATQAVERWSLLAVRLHHALGEVKVGEASVVVQVACGHRAEAFEACRWLIDELKSVVPIWKREAWDSGSTWSPGQPLATPGLQP
ncbi:MAG: molybdenum cofactor biosynthesis protein MoaE [Phycisphaerales bacterium]|nr:molybdenum cofactor biosynthesis protein MoaE [Phycisphaerales bacterium]